MTLDTALDWNVGHYLDHELFLNMRLTNILTPAELLEEVRTGDDFRLSLEMVPTRSPDYSATRRLSDDTKSSFARPLKRYTYRQDCQRHAKRTRAGLV